MKNPTNIFIKNKSSSSSSSSSSRKKKEKKKTAWAASLETAGHRLNEKWYNNLQIKKYGGVDLTSTTILKLNNMSHSVEFSLPNHIRDFIFDLHDAMRRSQRMGEVQRLYDVGVKEITEKYFSSSPWPDTKSISSVVRDDEVFLLIYRSAFYSN